MIQAFLNSNNIVLTTSGEIWEISTETLCIVRTIYNELKKKDKKAAEQFKENVSELLEFCFYSMKELEKYAENLPKQTAA